MNLQILESNVFQLPVSISPGKGGKKVGYSANVIKDNVMVLILEYLQSDPTRVWRFGYLKSDFNVNGWAENFPQNGRVAFLTFLKFLFKEQARDSNNNPQFVFDIGVGDGTGKDFNGNMAGEMTLTFSPENLANSFHGVNGSTFNIPFFPFGPGVGTDFLLDPSSDKMMDALRQFESVTISINMDANRKIMLEQFVDIHLFGPNGNLLSVFDLDSDGPVTYNHKMEHFYMLASIKGKDQGDGNYLFEIGDPEEDAKVKVTEEDV
jgi:hypothetical protein